MRTPPAGRRPTRRAGTARRVAALGMLVPAAALAALSQGPGAGGVGVVGRGSSGGRTPAGPAGTASFAISGSVGGLYPGRTVPLALTVTNPQVHRITVTSLVTTVSDASPSCLAANLTVTAFTGHLAVAAGHHATATVHVTMAHSAPDACQGSHFAFRYRGQGTEA